jgi:hypothetical protein
MLPPPTTTAICAPASLASFISRQSRMTTSTSMP